MVGRKHWEERGQHGHTPASPLTSLKLTGIKIKLIPFSPGSSLWPPADGSIIPTQSLSLSSLLLSTRGKTSLPGNESSQAQRGDEEGIQTG